MASYYATFGEQPYELTVSLRVAQRISTKFKRPVEQLVAHMGEALPGEMVDVLKMGLADDQAAKEMEAAVLDSGCGVAALRTTACNFLLELAYPGTPEEKEAVVDATLGADEAGKNGIRAMLGLPLKQITAPSDTGNG